jgi:hypothetical protein
VAGGSRRLLLKREINPPSLTSRGVANSNLAMMDKKVLDDRKDMPVISDTWIL